MKVPIFINLLELLSKKLVITVMAWSENKFTIFENTKFVLKIKNTKNNAVITVI